MELWTALVSAVPVQLANGDRWSWLVKAVGLFIQKTQPTAGMLVSHSWLVGELTHFAQWTFTQSSPLLSPQGIVPEVVCLPAPPTPFLLVLTTTYAVVTVLSPDERQCLWSWHSQAVELSLQVLTQHLSPRQQAKWHRDSQLWGRQPPTCELLTLFQSLCLEVAIPDDPPPPNLQPIQAIAHEVKTTLSTILTLTRSVQKRRELSPSLYERLELISQECLQQSQRFELLLQAAYLQSSPPPVLSPIPLDSILNLYAQQWQNQAQQRYIHFHIHRCDRLPPVLSHQALLSQVLQGLVDHLSRHLPSHSQIDLYISPVGQHLKCQFQVQLPHPTPPPQTIGDSYSLHTETGNLSLSLTTAKAIVELLGGRLTIRAHTTGIWVQEQIITVFLPIASDIL
ncbi:MAG: hypothetical protein ACK4QL_09945 [Pseudanabaenaceae cyanobacterium]